jgi:hypothetical protein
MLKLCCTGIRPGSPYSKPAIGVIGRLEAAVRRTPPPDPRIQESMERRNRVVPEKSRRAVSRDLKYRKGVDPVKLLIVSDIHANLEALQAVLAESHDELWVLGDLVNYGPNPSEVVELVRRMPPWWFKGTTIMRSATARTHGAPTPSGRWPAPCRTTRNPS